MASAASRRVLPPAPAPETLPRPARPLHAAPSPGTAPLVWIFPLKMEVEGYTLSGRSPGVTDLLLCTEGAGLCLWLRSEGGAWGAAPLGSTHPGSRCVYHCRQETEPRLFTKEDSWQRLRSFEKFPEEATAEPCPLLPLATLPAWDTVPRPGPLCLKGCSRNFQLLRCMCWDPPPPPGLSTSSM